MSNSLLGIQFSDQSVKAGDKHIRNPRARKPMSDADCVYGQLTDDYPRDALKWVHSVEWSGPKEVPLSRIDWDDARVWKAAHEADHVRVFVKKIKEEESKGDHLKPVVLIGRPVDKGKAPDMITDGHHRSLAYRKLSKPVWAWEGKVRRRTGPWDYLHDSQFKDDGKKDIYR